MRTIFLFKLNVQFLLVAILLFVGSTGFSQNFNRPVPPPFPDYEFKRLDTTGLNGYYLVAPYNKYSTGTKFAAIIDEEGYIVWWTADSRKFFDFKYHFDHGIFTFTNPLTQFERRHFVMDENFMIIDSLQVPNGDIGDIHEFQVFPNGNMLITTLHDTVMDLSGYVFNGSPGDPNAIVKDWILYEYDCNQNIVFEWHAMEHLTPDYYVDGYPFNTNGIDIIHGNSVDMDFDGNLLLSMRFTDACVKIDHTTGDVIWTLGGNHNDFTFVNDIPFISQHDIRRMPNGNVTIFDNRMSAVPDESRAIEYELDTVNWTATKVSEYIHPSPVNAVSMGNYQLRDDGYGMVGWGNTLRPQPSLTLHDPNRNEAASFYFRDSIISYRSFFQELNFTPQRPEITCQPSGNDFILSGPMSANYYLWSTGESTPSITVSDTGTYQLWVDHGIGMMGSEPFFIDANTGCGNVGIEDANHSSNRIIVAIYDVVGRKISHPRNGLVYIVQYLESAIPVKVIWNPRFRAP